MKCSNFKVGQLRGGTTFDPVLSVKEVGHVKHMHAVSLLIHPNFSPNFMVTCLDLFENSLLIRFQTDRKFTFDPVRTNGAGSKVSFRSVYQARDPELFEISLLIHLHQFEPDQK